VAGSTRSGWTGATGAGSTCGGATTAGLTPAAAVPVPAGFGAEVPSVLVAAGLLAGALVGPDAFASAGGL
jgi:hypothetical protein